MKTGYVLLCALLAFPALASRLVADDAGNKVTVPDQVTRIADAWFAHHSVLMTLGAGSNIVATVNHPVDRPWMFKINPALNNALQIKGISFNSEALLAHQTDVVFVAKGNPDVAAYHQANLPVLEMAFTDYPSLEHSVSATANVLGTEQAQQRAVAYNRYLEERVAAVLTKTVSLSEQQRPSVLHIPSLNPLKVDGSNTLIDTWITLAGGKNAAQTISGNMKEVSPEQVLAWQPDIIILGQGCGEISQSRYAQLFSGLKAVQEKKVWANPAGVFPWDRYGTESALQIQWAAHQLHPALFADTDMVSITRDFYRRFFDYPLSRDEAARILHGQPPA